MKMCEVGMCDAPRAKRRYMKGVRVKRRCVKRRCAKSRYAVGGRMPGGVRIDVSSEGITNVKLSFRALLQCFRELDGLPKPFARCSPQKT